MSTAVSSQVTLSEILLDMFYGRFLFLSWTMSPQWKTGAIQELRHLDTWRLSSLLQIVWTDTANIQTDPELFTGISSQLCRITRFVSPRHLHA